MRSDVALPMQEVPAWRVHLGMPLGGAVALRVLADTGVPVFAGAIVNGAIRMRSVVDLFPGDHSHEAG